MAFHPYPQLIPPVFNLGGFGPPRALTRASTWPWVDHSASGLDPATQNALFRLAFATASPHGLTSPLSTNSQAHSSKGTPSHTQRHALTACRHMVSGTISLPSRGTFHHSLTVLIHYRSVGSIQAYQVVLADSHTIPRAACYSRTPNRPAERISTTGLTPSTVRDSTLFVYTPAPQPLRLVDLRHWVSQPQPRNPYQVSHVIGLAPSAFARHYSQNHLLVFSSYRY